jgi:hypothetical protein
LEIKNKTVLLMKVNKEYPKEQKIKISQEKHDREKMIKKGLDPDKKKKVYVKKNCGSHNIAVEAFEKMAAEKRISTKIDYDVLKILGFVYPKPGPVTPDDLPS